MLLDSKKIVLSSAPFSTLRSALRDIKPCAPVVAEHLAGSLLAFIAAGIYEETKKPLLIIGSDEDRAEQLRDDCAVLLGGSGVQLFGTRPMHYAQAIDMSATIGQVETLKALSSSTAKVVIASSVSILEKIPSPAQFRTTVIEIENGKEYDFQQLIDRI